MQSACSRNRTRVVGFKIREQFRSAMQIEVIFMKVYSTVNNSNCVLAIVFIESPTFKVLNSTQIASGNTMQNTKELTFYNVQFELNYSAGIKIKSLEVFFFFPLPISTLIFLYGFNCFSNDAFICNGVEPLMFCFPKFELLLS